MDCTASLPTGGAGAEAATSVRVCVISDTHGAHRSVQLPSGVDVLVCCGDFTEDGTDEEVDDFLAWFAVQPARSRILILGNHEVALTRKHSNDARALAERLSAAGRVTYLQGSAIEACGLRIFGTPWMALPTSEIYAHAAWCLPDTSPALGDAYAAIPAGLDLLLTHTPPKGVLDGGGLGSAALASAVAAKRPRVHCFGHCHSSYGHARSGDVLHVNAAIDATAPEGPIYFDLAVACA